jgi:hypothetical protein
LPQGLPKKIQFQLLLPDLALQITNALAGRRKIRNPHGFRHRLGGPTCRPQGLSSATAEMHAPLIQMGGRHPEFAGQGNRTLPSHHSLNRRELELAAENPALSCGHRSSFKKVPCFPVSF